MAKVYSILLFLIIGTSALPAQHLINKSLQSKDVSKISVDGNHISKISIRTNPHGSEIELRAKIDDKYPNDLNFEVDNLDGDLFIRIEKNLHPDGASNKLDAHKFLVSELEIFLPTDLSVDLKSNIASVLIWGRYNNIRIKLDSGFLEFDGWSRKAEVKTNSADVLINTDNSIINAATEYGILQIPSGFSRGFSVWNIESVHGNISAKIIK